MVGTNGLAPRPPPPDAPRARAVRCKGRPGGCGGGGCCEGAGAPGGVEVGSIDLLGGFDAGRRGGERGGGSNSVRAWVAGRW